MNNLTTRKIVLGMLMALVLALGVQGTADALKFGTSRTGDLQTALPNQLNGFKIRFSVTLGGNTTRITDANGNLIKDSTTTGGEANARIDSSGYLVVEIDDKDYRTIVTNPTGTLVVDPRPTYSDDDPGDAGSPSLPYYVDSSKNVVDSTGKAVYVQTGGGIRADNSDPNPDNRIAANPWRYTRAKAEPTTKVPDLNRYHYNEEAVTISVSDAYITKVGRYEFTDTSKTTHTLLEKGKDDTKNKLSGSVEVTFNATAAAVVQISITDATPPTDAPADGKADPIQFTVYVVQQQSAVENQATTFASGKDGVEYGYDTEDPRIDSYFVFAAEDAPVNYSVEGSGRVYVSVSQDRRTSATNTLWTSSEAPVYLDINRGTSKVTAYISGNPGKTAVYIFSGQDPTKYPSIEITQGNPQIGATESRLEEPLAVKVTDGNNRPIAGVAVSFATDATNSVGSGQMFIPVPGTTVYTTTVDGTALVNNTVNTTEARANRPAPSTTIWVQTDRNGVAQVYYQLSDTTGDHQVIASLRGDPFSRFKTFDATSVDASRSASLVLVSGDNQRSDADTYDVEDPLVVRVRRPGGYRIAGVKIRFTALTGVLERAPGTLPPTAEPVGPSSGQEIYALTNAHGEAGVVYNSGQIAGAKTVTARVDDELSEEEYQYQIRQVVFNIDGGGSSTTTGGGTTGGGTTGGGTTGGTGTLTVRPTSITGQPGSEHDIRVAASAGVVTVGNLISGEFLSAGGTAEPRTSSGTFTSTLTLPNTQGTYNLVVSSRDATETIRVTVSSTAAGTQTGGTLAVRINPASGAPGTTATVTVTATGDDGNAAANVPVTLSITSGGGTFSLSTVTTGANGVASSILTRGSTPGIDYFITATASGYEHRSVLPQGERVRITGTAPSTTTRTTGDPDILDIYDGNNQDGSLNSPLAEPLVVEVVDANDRPVDNVRVRFRTTIGSGRFSPRTPRTDEDGFAETTFTPTSPGRIRVVATVAGVDSTAAFTVQAGEPADALEKISGDTQSGTPDNALAKPFVVEVQDEDGEPLSGHRVTFEVTAGGGSLSETSAAADEDGRAETTLTLGSERGVNSVQASVTGVDAVTFSTSIEPKILVAAANRPVMYWIDNSMLYGLAGAKAAKIAENVNGVAIGGGKVYWTEKTGESGGTINSANLDGDPDVTELASIFATPVGIAVDAAGSNLYWTNASGRIQSANLDGSRIQNVLQNLSNPTDIVVSNGFIYWTEDGNTIRRVNSSGQKIVIDVAVNLDTVGGLAVGGGKVYWTEQTSATAGTVNGANLNGTNFETLATLLSAPMGISVDTAGSKLYWTNARGRVQSANLDGSRIKNVVEGLISASKLAIGGANVATVATKPTTPKADTSDYDVDNDGKVDNTDAALVAGAMNTGDAKYDVNDDGAVNFLDLLLVFDNRDDDAAAAPAIVGIKLNAVQIDRIEEQIDLLIATNDRSPAALRTLVYLQQLLVTARPEKTQLFANYPNPFNPETWIPYELATDTHVKITIYNTQGVVIRTLQFGHQSAGYYTDRDRAAYWDGRNALGEQVASGLYFYQLETDEMSSLRKMVILK